MTNFTTQELSTIKQYCLSNNIDVNNKEQTVSLLNSNSDARVGRGLCSKQDCYAALQNINVKLVLFGSRQNYSVSSQMFLRAYDLLIYKAPFDQKFRFLNISSPSMSSFLEEIVKSGAITEDDKNLAQKRFLVHWEKALLPIPDSPEPSKKFDGSDYDAMMAGK